MALDDLDWNSKRKMMYAHKKSRVHALGRAPLTANQSWCAECPGNVYLRADPLGHGFGTAIFLTYFFYTLRPWVCAMGRVVSTQL